MYYAVLSTQSCPTLCDPMDCSLPGSTVQDILQAGILAAAAAAKLLQSCLTLCDPRDGSPSGSPVLGILQARTLEWVDISFFNAWKWKVKMKSLSHVQLLATPWTAAYQGPSSMGFSRQEYWSGLPFLSPEDLPNPGTEPKSSASPALAGRFFTTELFGKPFPLSHSSSFVSCYLLNSRKILSVSPYIWYPFQIPILLWIILFCNMFLGKQRWWAFPLCKWYEYHFIKRK